MKLGSKILAGAVAATMAMAPMSLTGCSGCTPQEPEEPVMEGSTSEEIHAKDIEITNAGYTILDSGMATYAFMATNPNVDFMGVSLTFDVQAMDAEGNVVFLDTPSLSYLYSDQTLPVVGTCNVITSNVEVAELSIEPNMGDARWLDDADTLPPDTSVFSATANVADISGVETLDGEISVNLATASDYSVADSTTEEAPSPTFTACVKAVFKDANGNAIGGAESDFVTLDESCTNFALARNEALYAGNTSISAGISVADPAVAHRNFIIRIPQGLQFASFDLYPSY